MAEGTFTDGSTQDVTADVAWGSGDTDVATISNADGSEGEAFGKAQGMVTITAVSSETDENGDPIQDNTSLEVTAAELESLSITPSGTSRVPVNFQLQLTATGSFTDGTTQDLTQDPDLDWSSFDTNIATVNNVDGSGDKGRVTGQAAGNTSILAQKDDVQDTKGITVAEDTLTDITISNDDADNEFGGTGETVQFFAKGSFDSGLSDFELTQQVTWSSDNELVCTISNDDGSEGEATATGVGTCTITATRDGVTSNEIQMTNSSP